MAIPSPSPSPSPHSFSRHPHSPNIFITSPTSPSPYSSAHSRSPSRESLANAPHAALPTLTIPTGPSQFHHALHTPSSSPTTSDFVPSFFTPGQGHTRSLGHMGVRLSRQPNITLTLDTEDNGRVEKRPRTESDHANDGQDGLRQDMDIVPNEAGEDVKLPSPISLTGGTSPTTATSLACNQVVGSRSRSDSAPLWEGNAVQGGLSANWTGRGRSASSFGQ